MRGEAVEVPGIERDAHAAQPLDLAGEGIEQRLLAWSQRLEDVPGGVGHRRQRPAQVLGQSAQQRGHELPAEGGHEPFEAVGSKLRQRLERDVDGHTVALGARLEAVAEGQRQIALAPGAGSAVGVDGVRGLGRDEQVARVGEQVGVLTARVAPPAVEVRARDDVGRDPLVEEGEQDLVAYEHVTAPGAALELVDLLEQAAVLGEEGVARVPVALDQGAADEELARERGIDLPVGDGAPGDHR
jgi:hypothetical protein